MLKSPTSLGILGPAQSPLKRGCQLWHFPMFLSDMQAMAGKRNIVGIPSI